MTDRIIVANPGTGKTAEIVEEVARLLRSGIRGEDIACVTFTNKAADEMKARIFKGVATHQELIGEALKLEVSTIHGFIKNYLESRGITVNFASNTVLRYLVYEKLVELGTFNYGTEYLAGTIVPKIENGIRYLKSFGIVPEKIAVENVISIMTSRFPPKGKTSLSGSAISVLVRDFKEIFQYYEDFKKEHSLMDFNDILRVFLEMGDFNQKQYVLVDEFQDLNRMQVDIVSKLGRFRFFVGDRKQSIFGFQGGSLSSFQRYLSGTDFEIRGKTLNFRSTNNILKFAKSYLTRYSRDEQAVNEIRDLRNEGSGDGKRVQLVSSSTPEADAVSKLREIMSQHSGVKRDYAIISRTNGQLEKVAKFLDEAGIPYSSTVTSRVNRGQIGDILAFISGLVSEDPTLISRALLTPFSGLTLQESVSLSSAILRDGEWKDHVPQRLLELRAMKFGLALIDHAFERIILPVASSIGQDYFSSARSVFDSAHEYLEAFKDYSLEGFLQFMSLSAEPPENDLRESEVNLLTVHKAKGLAFDSVIYIPSETRSSLEYFDTMTYSIIYASTGIDVERDLLEEPLRIDFVALTRAREELIVVGADRILSRYDTGCPCQETGYASGIISSSTTGRYNEPYMLFVNGRIEEAKKLLEKKNVWLLENITSYFSGLSRLSYSTLEALSDPYRFLRTRILRIRETSPFSRAGEEFHQLAQHYLEGRIELEKIPQEHASEFTNLEAAIGILREEYRFPPLHTELKVEMPLSALFPERGVPDGLMIEGRFDAVFQGNGNSQKYLVADYKTSRQQRSDYWHQLWLYTRMFQKYYNARPENVSGGIIYLNLREAVETGEKSLDVQIRDSLKIKTDVVENRISEIIAYMERPDLFVEKLLSKSPATELDVRLSEKLSNLI